VLGRETTAASGLRKSKVDVRSPTTARRQGVMFGSTTPKRCSMNRMSAVWSKSSESTQPPLLHGETTILGTRKPRPIGPGAKSEFPWKFSRVASTVESP
jgi:hypothetical protein